MMVTMIKKKKKKENGQFLVFLRARPPGPQNSQSPPIPDSFPVLTQPTPSCAELICLATAPSQPEDT